MSKKIVQINEEIIKNEWKESVRSSPESDDNIRRCGAKNAAREKARAVTREFRAMKLPEVAKKVSETENQFAHYS